MGRGAIFAAIATIVLGGGGVAAQAPGLADQQQRLLAAKRAAAIAARRADTLATAAAVERDKAARARAEEDALAARVTLAEADLAAARARVGIIDRMMADQRARLGERQAPVARLLAALSSLARRPSIVAIAQPGSVDDLVHVRAVLGSALPVVRARTAGIRAELAETRRLQASAALAATALRDGRAQLEASRVALASLEAAHRRRSQALGRGALTESDRALALGERARDIVDTMADTRSAQATAAGLALLPDPIPRPLGAGVVPPPRIAGAYRLPVGGRLVTGLDEISPAGVRSRGLSFAVAPGSVVSAPAGGRIAYSKRFRDYGMIVIIDHGDGWTSLVTGLGAARVAPGETVRMGSPLGIAGKGETPIVTVELRRRGRPIDIAALIG